MERKVYELQLYVLVEADSQEEADQQAINAMGQLEQEGFTHYSARAVFHGTVIK